MTFLMTKIAHFLRMLSDNRTKHEQSSYNAFSNHNTDFKNLKTVK